MQTSVERTNNSSESARPEFDPDGAMEGSDFLASVRDQFFDSNFVSQWPGQPNATQAERAKAELPVAVDKLFRCAAFDEDLPEADANTALGKLKIAADAVDWPNTAKIPSAWPSAEEETYRLYEVSCAVTIMIRAFEGRGGGGGPRTFPPPPDNP